MRRKKQKPAIYLRFGLQWIRRRSRRGYSQIQFVQLILLRHRGLLAARCSLSTRMFQNLYFLPITRTFRIAQRKRSLQILPCINFFLQRVSRPRATSKREIDNNIFQVKFPFLSLRYIWSVLWNRATNHPTSSRLCKIPFCVHLECSLHGQEGSLSTSALKLSNTFQ